MNEPIYLHSVPGVLLRLLEPDDAPALLAYYKRNEPHHRSWSPLPPTGFFNVDFQRRRLDASLRLRGEGREYRFGICSIQPEEELIGTITLTAIEYGAFQNGRFGYSVDALRQSRGIMTASLSALIRFAFTELDLHRVEANIMPRNTASRRVLEKCGFLHIGFSPRMLFINGAWEDHDMYMRLRDEDARQG